LKPGNVVVGAFPGAEATKVRPAVVLSTELYRRRNYDTVSMGNGANRLRIARLAAGWTSPSVVFQVVCRHIAAA